MRGVLVLLVVVGRLLLLLHLVMGHQHLLLVMLLLLILLLFLDRTPLLLLSGCHFAFEASGSVLPVEPFPDARKEGLLTAKLHLGPLFVVRAAQLFQTLLDLGRALAAAHHVVVENVQGLGRVRQSLDARRKETTRTVPTKAVATGQTGKARRQSLALAETVGFCEHTRLHLTEQMVRKGRSVGLVLHGHQGRRIRHFPSRLGEQILVHFVSVVVVTAVGDFVAAARVMVLFRSSSTTATATTSSILHVRHGVALGGKELVRVAAGRTLPRRLLLTRQTGQRWRTQRRVANTVGRVHQTQTERALDPVALGGPAAGVVGLEGLVAAHDVVGHGRTVVQVALQEIHGGVVDGRNGGRVVDASAFAGLVVAIFIQCVAVRTANANLTNLNRLALALGGRRHVAFTRRKHFDAVATDKAVERGQPVLVGIHGQGHGLLEHRKRPHGHGAFVDRVVGRHGRVHAETHVARAVNAHAATPRTVHSHADDPTGRIVHGPEPHAHAATAGVQHTSETHRKASGSTHHHGVLTGHHGEWVHGVHTTGGSSSAAAATALDAATAGIVLADRFVRQGFILGRKGLGAADLTDPPVLLLRSAASGTGTVLRWRHGWIRTLRSDTAQSEAASQTAVVHDTSSTAVTALLHGGDQLLALKLEFLLALFQIPLLLL